MSAHHTAFAIEGDNSIITRLKSSILLRKENTEFVEGPTQRTLPGRAFERPLQAVLIDGPHAFPFPQLEYYYLYPHIASDGLLILDDIHIRTINQLYRFLCADKMFELIEVVERTAFFRRTTAPVFDPFGDGWWLQSYNRKRLSRYIWREILMSSMPQQVRALLRKSRAAVRSGLSPRERYLIQIDLPPQNSVVDETAIVQGRADLPSGACLWLFARRADSSGWWPQGRCVTVSDNRWQQACKFGEVSDAGYAFDIAAMTTDERGQRRILRWFDEGARSVTWGPIDLPKPVAGSGVVTTRVFRRAD